MKRTREEPVCRGHGEQGALANKRNADAFAHALASTIREIWAAGYISRRDLADELNQRRIRTARRGRWHYTSVVRILKRLGLLTWGVGVRKQTKKRAADMRAEALASTIAKIHSAGFVSLNAITRELNRRAIPTPQGGKWYPTSVKRLLQRLQGRNPPRATRAAVRASKRR